MDWPLHAIVGNLLVKGPRAWSDWRYAGLSWHGPSASGVSVWTSYGSGAPWGYPRFEKGKHERMRRMGLWDQIRPISVSAGLYRLWARVRAKEMLKILSGRPTGLIKPNLLTTAIWGMLSDYLDWSGGRMAKPAGLVLDIVKIAFTDPFLLPASETRFTKVALALLGKSSNKYDSQGTPRWFSLPG